MAHEKISASLGNDPLGRMRVFTLAAELAPDSWKDANELAANAVTELLSRQLYASVGSITANIAEGYSRSSGKDRVRFFEYALGSVRESMGWYRHAEPVIGAEVVADRLDRLEEMRRILLAIIPRERGRTIRKSES
jgi:four helix bundle protein